jgi:hypothetical protein
MMDGPTDESPEQQPLSGWLSDTFRQLNFVALMRERNQIRRTCSQLLSIYQEVATELPQAAKMDIYARVVEKHCGADSDGVRRILRRAAESFAAWPEERDLIFRDLVNYFAVTECRCADPKNIGVRTDVIDIVSNSISADL